MFASVIDCILCTWAMNERMNERMNEWMNAATDDDDDDDGSRRRFDRKRLAKVDQRMSNKNSAHLVPLYRPPHIIRCTIIGRP